MRSMMSLSILCGLMVAASAQDFEMFEPPGVLVARVEVRPGRLVMYEALDTRLYFSREHRYDSIDGRFVGYFNYPLNRILRFPRSGRGQMETADLDDFAPHYRLTFRYVRPLVDGAGPPIPPPIFGYGSPGYGSPGYGGPGYVGPGMPGPFLPGPGFGGVFPIGPVGPIGPPLPQSVLIDSQTLPNPPLPPVRLELRNGGPREIQVGVVDLEEPSQTRSLRIAPGGSTEVKINRDAGARQVQNFRVVTPYGDSETREIVNNLPPRVRYEIVVHEWAVQSVAIDRTAGAGDDPIEDINFNGKSLGRFPLPPGNELGRTALTFTRRRETKTTPAPSHPFWPKKTISNRLPIRSSEQSWKRNKTPNAVAEQRVVDRSVDPS